MIDQAGHSLRFLGLLRGAAPAICATAGVELPDGLLDRGLPAFPLPAQDPPPSLATGPDRLDSWVDLWLSGHPCRKGAGLYLTPHGVARDLLRLVEEDAGGPASVLDPAVGCGVFLVQAREQWGPSVDLHGWDLDPFAVAATRLALWIGRAVDEPQALTRRILWRDALPARAVQEPAGRRFDLVCGNPPFGNAIERRTGRGSEERGRFRSIYPETARGAYDRSVLFVRRAGDLLRDRGSLAMLLPRALLCARYATGLRDWMAREAPLRTLVRWPGDRSIPEAEVAMVGLIAGRGSAGTRVRVHTIGPSRERVQSVPRPHDPGSWGELLEPRARPLRRSLPAGQFLGGFFHVRAAATAAEGYRLATSLTDGGIGWRFLTSGLITRFGDCWGERTARCLGRRLLHPVLPRDAPAVPESRRILYDAPKVIVAGLSSRFRARLDSEGRYAGSVGTFLVLTREDGERSALLLRRAALLLNSEWYSSLHRLRRGGAALAGGSIPLSRRDLEEMPFPAIFGQDRPDRRLAMLDSLDPLLEDDRIQEMIRLLARIA